MSHTLRGMVVKGSAWCPNPSLPSLSHRLEARLRKRSPSRGDVREASFSDIEITRFPEGSNLDDSYHGENSPASEASSLK
jgi:hypothetical protein